LSQLLWRSGLLLVIVVLSACAAPLQTPPHRAIGGGPQPPQTAPLSLPKESGALSPEAQALLAQFPSRGPAPELTNETWLNSQPLRLADLRGKVVIVEFWTYG
jgi:hypothetical protein